MKKRAQFQLSFSWIFALIVGAIILFLAIYVAVKIIGLGQESSTAETATQIGTLLNPLETGFETTKSVPMSLRVESRIYAECDDSGGNGLGNQIIKVSQKSLGDWTKISVNTYFKNKYIFSEEYVQGKRFFVLSSPFEFPFKVANVFVLTEADKKYCFINTPEDVERELSDVQENILTNNCTGVGLSSSSKDGVINVCFNSGQIASGNCDVFVNYNPGGNNNIMESFGYVVKN